MLFCDLGTPYQITFQDIASPTMYGIVELHDHILFYLIIVFTVVAWFLLSACVTSNPVIYAFNHGHTLEFFWTILPAVVLGFIALPSFRLLYLMDELFSPDLTVKAIGNQWYWTYEYSDTDRDLQFDSFMTSEDLRQLSVDNSLVLPVNTSIRVLVTAADVIHSFAVPSLGIKMDAVPGRLNAASFIISRPGLFFGQCSELCGALHSAMPIAIKAVSTEEYLNWLDLQD